MIFFFFKQKTAYEMRISDWSSDVCSSDLQKSRKRVWEIAAAVWSAVAQRRLTYAEPPASFERNGQKIRTPGEVLDNGIATCLDSAVLFASALEQIGLRPLIAFPEGHPICGPWLQPQTPPRLPPAPGTETVRESGGKEG